MLKQNTAAPQKLNRRSALLGLAGGCIAIFRLPAARAQGAAQVRMQLEQQALIIIQGRERAGLAVTLDTSPAAEALKARSPPGKAVPIIYLAAGLLSIPSISLAIQEMLRHQEYGGVVIDTQTTPVNIHHDQSLEGDLVMAIRADGSIEKVRSTLATQDFLQRILSGSGGKPL